MMVLKLFTLTLMAIIAVGSTSLAFAQTQGDVVSEDLPAIIKLDKDVYSWTDKVNITVTSPFHNSDSNSVEEIGAAEPYPITIRTKDHTIENYRLVETGANTGVFTGRVTLSGFPHDADGNTRTGSGDGNDANPKTTGRGPTDGFLQTRNSDQLFVQFEYSEDVLIVGSALVRWNTGMVQWLDDHYSATGAAIVRVTDPDMNLNPEKADHFTIDVWSGSDGGGIALVVTETGMATGIFEGTVSFVTAGQSSGNTLRVTAGDAITAEYEDNTLPDPYTIEDELDILGTAMINPPANSTAPDEVSEEILLAPIKQMRNGVMPSKVICDESLEKIYRPSGYAAACVKPSSIDRLTERGWSIHVLK